ncbi:hypothetical protein ACIFQM_24440 [Paenibacillus sp. NRS-1782]|uniref:hypothetical protein n=1 Tax=unclassified Paenibacillus TaxID=185978 RepID=UPI003D2785E0
MNVGELREWIINNNIEHRSIEGFWIAFNNYMEESPDEFKIYFNSFSEQFLDIKVQQVALMISDYPEYESIHVVTYIPIIYNSRTIGLFRLFFSLDGVVYDDYFTLD